MIDNTEIINDIDSHIQSQAGGYNKWYVGITDEIDRRLHQEHNVPKKNAWFIHRAAADKTAAEMIEKYFLDNGCQGDTGGGNENTKYVYAYLITNSTVE